jgi:two-component system alkaline phosphatase synthesis response regulator PhoP
MDTRTVLVVDDDAAIVGLLQEILEDHGYRVLAAVGGAALRQARENHPEVILLDLLMPGMDGVAVARCLRGNRATAHIPIIAMSAAGRLWATAPRLPADALLAKPFHFGDVCALVDRWMPVA